MDLGLGCWWSFERSSPSTTDEPHPTVDPDEIVHPIAQLLKLVPFESCDAETCAIPMFQRRVIAGTAWASSDSECEFDPIWEDEKSVSCPVRSHWRGSLPSALVSGVPRRQLGVKTGAPNMYDDQSASRR